MEKSATTKVFHKHVVGTVDSEVYLGFGGESVRYIVVDSVEEHQR